MLALFGPVASGTDGAGAATIEEAVAAALAVQMAEPVTLAAAGRDLARVSDGDQSMKSSADCSVHSAASASSRRSSGAWGQGRQCRSWSRSKVVAMSVGSD